MYKLMCCVSSQNPRMTHSVALSDKYELPAGRVYMNGTQALVRLLLAQKARDEAAGLNTEGFVSGYRGSPLGAVDQELWRNRSLLEQHKVRFQPGLNEELAATAVWGTQMVSLDPKARVDGVFALWYGKGPGVDRSGDVFKHGNIAGGAPHGGVLLVAGDDHACKSSSLPHQSEHAFIAAMKEVGREARENPEIFKDAPCSTIVSRLDETLAARKPVLRWVPDEN